MLTREEKKALKRIVKKVKAQATPHNVICLDALLNIDSRKRIYTMTVDDLRLTLTYSFGSQRIHVRSFTHYTLDVYSFDTDATYTYESVYDPGDIFTPFENKMLSKLRGIFVEMCEKKEKSKQLETLHKVFKNFS